MSRKVVVLALATVFAIAGSGPARALDPGPTPLKVTLSRTVVAPGGKIVIYFRGAPNLVYGIYIDSINHKLTTTLPTSPTGYGRKTIYLSRYAMPSSRHSIMVHSSHAAGTGSAAFRVDTVDISN